MFAGERVEAKAFKGFNGEVVIPEGNNLEYIGDEAFPGDVYGPEDFELKDSINWYNYYNDKKLYLNQGGTSSDQNGTYKYELYIKHIPSECEDKIKWTSSDEKNEICKIENQNDTGKKVEVCATRQKGGTVTITASTTDGRYKESYDITFFDPTKQVKESSDGLFSYYVTDETKKTATIVKYNGGYNVDKIVFPEEIDGYKVTALGHSYNGISYSFDAKVFVVPESIVTIEKDTFYDYRPEKRILVGKKNSSTEQYAKKYSNKDNIIFCEEDQMILNAKEETLWLDASMTNNTVEMNIAYSPQGVELSKLKWNSTDDEVASVNENGVVIAHKAGEATITAECGNLSAQCSVTVGNRCDGYYYKDLSDGTVEITGIYDAFESRERNIPSRLDNKKVTVIGSGAFDSYWITGVRIPDGVTTIKKHAFSIYERTISVSIPGSVKNIDDEAFENNVRKDSGKYIFYGEKGSVAQKYAEENSGIEFVEDRLIIENEQANYKYTKNLIITHLPIDIDKTKDKITWTSSRPDIVSIEYNSDFESAMTAKYTILTENAEKVEITCTVGNHTATIPIITDDMKEKTDGDYTYVNNSDGTVCITGYLGEEHNLHIPEKINGKLVRTVQGFEENEDLENVIIPKSVTEIAYNAFYNCINLSDVSFEKGSELKKIGMSAFSGSPIYSIEIPDGVTEIGEHAFAKCWKLTSVSLSKNLKGIDAYTFAECIKLDKIQIPDSVMYIGESAFLADGLTEIVIPDNLTSIGFEAFKSNKRLSSITIKNKKTFIDAGAFYGCAAESLKIGQNLRSMAFADDKKLTTITLEEGVTSIAYGAFRGCENLENITFPNSLKKVGKSVFEGTKWYEKQPEGALYANNLLFDCKGKPETIVIKDGTTEIGESAFSVQNNLKKVLIPSSVTTIQEQAFWSCDELERIVIPESVTTIEKDAISFATIAGIKGSVAECYANENGLPFEEAVPLDGVKIDQTEKMISRGESFTLTANCMPENTTEAEEIQWSSDNEQVAEVDQNGKVTAKTAGTTNIIASAGPMQ